MEEDSKPEAKPRGRSTPAPRREIPVWRIAMIVGVIAIVGLVSLYALHSLEQFLIRDSRFALNGPEGSPDTATLEIGANHASARRIEAVFAEDSGRSVYLLPLADRQAALRTVDWVRGFVYCPPVAESHRGARVGADTGRFRHAGRRRASV